jgi:hypothetical protein
MPQTNDHQRDQEARSLGYEDIADLTTTLRHWGWSWRRISRLIGRDIPQIRRACLRAGMSSGTPARLTSLRKQARLIASATT